MKNWKSLLIVVLTTACLPSLVHAQKWNIWKGLRNGSSSMASQLTQKVALSQRKYFAKQYYLFSPQEMSRISLYLKQTQNLSAEQAQEALRARPAAFAKQFAIPAVKKSKMLSIDNFAPYQTSYRLHLPAYPVSLFPGDMVRGMVLHNPEKELARIFNEGLLLSLCQKTPGNKRLIFMTNTISLATRYARVREPGVPIMIHIHGFNGEDNYITASEQDISPSQIVRVSALLNLNGKPVWGQVVPHGERFLFYPYKKPLYEQAQDAALRRMYPDEK